MKTSMKAFFKLSQYAHGITGLFNVSGGFLVCSQPRSNSDRSQTSGVRLCRMGVLFSGSNMFTTERVSMNGAL